ncbi:MAG: excinuclease ABC subunit UvrA [Pirellulaceae bacterium]|nr:excinuclease ABC subunit UvrA [Pirellulaceae bacterium]
MDNATIEVRGAREHNLCGVNVVLPRNQLIVFTGVSGSGKSSLAFDTLYAEGQRRYLESLSSYARQFIGQLPKPNVDYIGGLSPAISISQKSTSGNPRSTVGTITEIYDFLRVLYARVATGFCPECQVPITSQTRDQIIARLQGLTEAPEYLILAPLIRGQKGEYRDLFESLQRQGFARARVDGQIYRLAEVPALQRQQKHDIEVVVTRYSPSGTPRTAVADAVLQALKLGSGTLIVTPWHEPDSQAASPPTDTEAPKPTRRRAAKARSHELVFSSQYACPQCGYSALPPTPQLLSFNSPAGMCETCEGLGEEFTFAPQLIIPDPTRSLRRGAIELLGSWNDLGRWQRHLWLSVGESIEKRHGLQAGESLTAAWQDLPVQVRDEWLFGTGNRHITFTWRGGNRPVKYGGQFAGLVAQLMDQYRNAKNPLTRKKYEKFMDRMNCNACHGSRLNQAARQLRLQSDTPPPGCQPWLNLPELCELSVQGCLQFLQGLKLGALERQIAGEAVREITTRLQFLLNVGLDYLCLSRSAPTLSGGESQRIRLASQIGAGLVGVLYVLDEPSIGLHPRDNDRLIQSLQNLRDLGNTLIVVEHDEDTMRAADLIVDFGPGPGVRGGQVMTCGSLPELTANPHSWTGKFLSGSETIPVPATQRAGTGQSVRVLGATHNNLKNIDVDIPLGKLVCVTGVSGSGKSSLINEVLAPVLRRRLHAAEDLPGQHRAVEGIEHLDKVIVIDQSPIGRTPRSNPGTYVKAFDEIRSLFVDLPDARRRGYQPGRFSFNVQGGRCEACQGNGSNKLEMDFLADLWVPCTVCNGQRYNHETLQVKFKGHSIADVLEMDVAAAVKLFENQPRILEKLQALHDVGLDYLKLGQPSPTLSGGEAQRIKLAKELSRRATGRTLYLLDEPTTGLHFYDIRLLLKVLQDLVDLGNTVLVIEHNMDVIRAADWIIDIGPDGGEAGGELIFAGTPVELLQCPRSHTAAALNKHLSRPAIAVPPQKASPKRRVQRPAAVGRTPVLTIEGATEHNLKDVSLQLPHHQMNVFCGPSGSGKSSLAMDTIYAEGQRRYVESLSSYARQFVGQMPKPHAQRIDGLGPSIAIEQKSVAHNPRSTVGTVTEIYDYLRVLMARLGQPMCPACDVPVSSQTPDDITQHLLELPEGTRLILTAPLRWQPSMDPQSMWQNLRSGGLSRVRINGRIHSLDSPPELTTTAQYTVEAVVDRLMISAANRSRIAESVELALSMGSGVLGALVPRDDVDEIHWQSTRHSLHLACRQCGYSMSPLTPHSFSFNSPLGWCSDCEGLGTQTGTSLSVLVDAHKSLDQGAIRVWPMGPQAVTEEDLQSSAGLGSSILRSLCVAAGIPGDVPFEKLSSGQRRLILYGGGQRWFSVRTAKGVQLEFQWRGLFPALEQAARLSPQLRARLTPFIDEVPCSACDGSRLNIEASAARFRNLNMADLTRNSFKWLDQQIDAWKLTTREQEIAGELLREIRNRVQFLLDVGLEYLSLSRPANTLSGGESQRIRLSSQLGSGLCGVVYVLDEPTIGLHPRDNRRLIGALHKLRDLGNTLVVVEHDRDVISSADRVYDFGPAAGRFGGQLIASGSPDEVSQSSTSVTGPYISQQQKIPIPKQRRSDDRGAICLSKARAHNLRDVDVAFPIGRMIAVTGPSGSGKSTLIHDVLHVALTKRLARQMNVKSLYENIDGVELIDKVIRVDQSPLGANPSSTPATYTGVYDLIRQLYSQLPLARAQGYTARQFSFNVPGGRCEKCEGLGQLRIEMHFLPDVWVQCDSCQGRRFTEDTLAIKYHGFSIHDILEMQIGQALEVFGNIPKIRKILQTLVDVGLDYVALGQSAPTLSGGEAQRVKLAAELSRPDTGKTFYLLDEPTTGLHFNDICKLLEVMHRLVDLGNTVIVIEHNLDVIKSADWVLDMGPEAGNEGGQLLFAGTPEDLVQYARRSSGKQRSKTLVLPRSHTGEALAELLKGGRYVARQQYDSSALNQRQSGDIDLEQIGRDTLLPWQADGRRWHCSDSLDRSGQPIRWQRDILIRVIERLESIDGFAPVKWDNRSIVEVSGPIKNRGWFMHAITADTWLLTLKFRVPRRMFTKAELEAVVSLPTLNQLEGVEAYGNQPRVRAQAAGSWMELQIRPHTLDELDQPRFWQWLEQASHAFLGKTSPAVESEIGAGKPLKMPWQILKQRWHALRKGFPPGKTIVWPTETLSVFIQAVHQVASGGRWRWDEPTSARYHLPGQAEPWIVLHTKRPEGLIAVFNGPKGLDLSQLENSLPVAVHATPRGTDGQQIQVAFTELQQPRHASVKKLMQMHVALCQASCS